MSSRRSSPDTQAFEAYNDYMSELYELEGALRAIASGTDARQWFLELQQGERNFVGATQRVRAVADEIFAHAPAEQKQAYEALTKAADGSDQGWLPDDLLHRLQVPFLNLAAAAIDGDRYRAAIEYPDDLRMMRNLNLMLSPPAQPVASLVFDIGRVNTWHKYAQDRPASDYAHEIASFAWCPEVMKHVVELVTRPDQILPKLGDISGEVSPPALTRSPRISGGMSFGAM